MSLNRALISTKGMSTKCPKKEARTKPHDNPDYHGRAKKQFWTFQNVQNQSKCPKHFNLHRTKIRQVC